MSDTVIVPDTFPVEWTLEQPNDPPVRVELRVRRSLRYRRYPRVLTSVPMPLAHALEIVERWKTGLSSSITFHIHFDSGRTETLRFTRRHVIDLRVVPA